MKKIIVLAAIVLLCSMSAHAFAAQTPIDQPSGSGSPVDQPSGSGAPIDQPSGSGSPVDQPDGGDIGDPKEIDTVQDVLNVIDRITNWMFTIFLAAAVIMILYAAFTYLTSGGGEEVAKAHKMILYSAVAIAVAVLAKGVVNVVKSIVTP